MMRQAPLAWLVAVASWSCAGSINAGPPELSPIQFLSGDADAAPVHARERGVRIEAGGDRFLVVWTDDRTEILGYNPYLSGNMQEIWGQVLDSDGILAGDPFLIASGGWDQHQADVSWNDDAQAWLVAFESETARENSTANVLGVRVSVSGEVLDADPIQLFEGFLDLGARNPAVTSDGVDWLVICNHPEGGTSQQIVFGRRIAADGALVDPEAVPLVISETLAAADVAFSDGVHLVLGWSGEPAEEIWFRLFDTDLNPLAQAAPLASGQRPRAAGNGIGFMVVSTRAFRIDSGGTVLDPDGIEIGRTPYSDKKNVAWTGQEWAISMDFDGAHEHGPGIQRIRVDGSYMDTNPILIEGNTGVESTAVASSGDRVSHVAYSTGYRLRAVRVERREVSAPIPFPEGWRRQAFVKGVEGPAGELMVVYLSSAKDEMRVLTQRMRQDGVLIDLEPTVVGTSGYIEAVDIGWNGEVYLAVWASGSGARARRLTPLNEIIDVNSIALGGGGGETGCAVTSIGPEFWIGVISDPVNTGTRVHCVRVEGRTGQVRESNQVAGGYSRDIAAASFGDRAIMTWSQYETYNSPTAYVEAVILNADGDFLFQVRVTDGVGTSPAVAVVPDLAQALIVWHDDSIAGEADIKGRFLDRDGQLASDDFTISSAVREQLFPEVAWTDETFVVAWNDYRHNDPGEQERADIVAARVMPDGTVLDASGMVVTNSSLPEDLPAVTGDNESAVFFLSMLHSPSGAPEIQRIAYRVMGAPVSYPPLTDVAIAFGTLLSGGLADVVETDNSYVRVRSSPGFNADESNVVDVRVGTESPLAATAFIDITVESRLDHPAGIARIRLRNWTTNAFDVVHEYPLWMFGEFIQEIDDIDAADYVRAGDRRIELSMRHLVMATFAPWFDSFTDWVNIRVR